MWYSRINRTVGTAEDEALVATYVSVGADRYDKWHTEPEASVNENYADVSDTYRCPATGLYHNASRTRNDVAWTPNGLKVYCSADKYGNRLARYWLTDSANVTARIRERNVAGIAGFVVEVFLNRKDAESGRWKGEKVATREAATQERATLTTIKAIDYYAVPVKEESPDNVAG